MVYAGTAFTCDENGKLIILKDKLFVVENGIIIKILDKNEEPAFTEKVKAENKLCQLKDNEYFLPGFIDLHLHAPQWAQNGNALDLPLYDWLQKYTFPVEAKCADTEYAKKLYSHLVKTQLEWGTTSTVYFATIHNNASLSLAQICAEKGMRGFIGRVAMDDKTQNPDFYRDESAEAAIKETENFIRDMEKIKCPQGVYPVVTPRFIPSCTDELLYGMAELADKYGLRVQGHCSENEWEHGYVYDRTGKRDTQALYDYGLLRNGGIYAHCTHLDEHDMEMFAQTGAVIAHCPLSNAYFSQKIAQIIKARRMGVKVGLGTDISAGYAPSIYQSIRDAAMVSRLTPDRDPDAVLPLEDAFHMATAGGGECLGIKTGRIAEGFLWDAQAVSTERMPIFHPHTDYEIWEKILLLTEREDIKHVWCAGKMVK